MNASWLQVPLQAPPITWQATPVCALPSWADARRVCVDVECRDDNLSELGPGVRRGGYVCGIAFAIEDGPAHYLPTRHQGGGNLPETAVWDYLRDQAATFSGDVVFNLASYDLDYLWENKVEFKRARFHRDTQVAAPVVDETQKTYGLDAIAARLGLPGKDETELRAHAAAWGIDPKRQLWRLHAGAVGRYGEQDARLPHQVLRRLERDIEDQGLGRAYDLESRVTLALMRMTRRGLRVDLDELDRVEVWAKQRIVECCSQIYHLTGVRVGSLSNAAELYPALTKRGIVVPTPIHGGTGKATPSITKLWLQQQDDEVARAIVSGREFVKLLGTYVNGYRKHMIGDRIYPSFKQLIGESEDGNDSEDGVRGVRISARHPNVHAQMKRSREIKKRWRCVHIADDGTEVYEADYSQAEPRWTVHYAEECRLPGGAEAAQRYRDNPRQDSYDLMLSLIGWGPEKRDDVKELYLGRSYGMGGGKLCAKLKLPWSWAPNPYDSSREYMKAGPDGQAIIDRFDAGVPYVKLLAKLIQRVVEARGYLILPDGRRMHFERMPDGGLKDSHKALNVLIQNVAGVENKYALVALDAAGLPIDLNVHDANRMCTADERQGWQMVEIMESALPKRVPSRVDLARAKNYGALVKLDPTERIL